MAFHSIPHSIRDDPQITPKPSLMQGRMQKADQGMRFYRCIIVHIMVESFPVRFDKEYTAMSKTRSLMLVILVLSLVTVPVLYARGTVEHPPTESVRTATDASGRIVTVAGPINRILVAGKAAIMPADALFLFPVAMETEVLLSVTNQGLGDFFNLIDPRFATQQRLGQQMGPEEIIAHAPDLVITKTSNYDSIVKQLEPFGIPVFTMNLETPQAWKEEIVQLGMLLGDEETPQRLNEEFDRREHAVASALEGLSAQERPAVLMMQAARADGITAFSVAPREWIQTTIVESAGGIPVWKDGDLAANAWRKVSFEQIARWDADHVFLISYKSPAQPFLEEIASGSQWQQLRAATRGNIRATPADVVNYIQSDSRWILGLQWLAAQLHPDRFASFDMESEIRSFYRDFYHITDEDILGKLVRSYLASMER
jgi:iron complex transport system substrate-binding protein